LKMSYSKSGEVLKTDVIEIQTAQEYTQVTTDKSHNLVVVNFYADWYLPCRNFFPIFGSMSTEYSVPFLRVDIDNVKDLGVKHPQIVLFKNGTRLTELSGVNVLGVLREVETVLRYEIERQGIAKHEPKVTADALYEAEREKTEIRDSVNPLKKSLVIFDEKGLKHFPKTDYILYETRGYSQIEAKIVQFNNEIGSSIHFWNKDDVELVKGLISNLSSSADKIDENQLSALSSMVKNWPTSHLFPALDVLRLVLLTTKGAVYVCTEGRNALARVLSIAAPSTPFASLLLVFRVIANMFYSPEGRKICEENATQIFSATKSIAISASKDTLQTAIATVLLNYSVYFCNSSKSNNLKSILISTFESLPHQQNEDVLLRVIVGLGNLAYKNDLFKQKSKSLKESFVQQAVKSDKIAPILTEFDIVVGGN